MNRRIAVITGLGLFLAAVLVALLPASTSQTKCGWWGAPEWTEAKSRDLAARYMDLADRSAALPDGFDTETGAATDGALQVARNYSECDSKLDTRRTFTFVLLGLSVLGPAAVLYVGGRRETVG